MDEQMEFRKTIRGNLDVGSINDFIMGCWFRSKYYNKDILSACADKENMLIAMCWDVIPNNRQYKSLALPKERYCSKVLTKSIQDRIKDTEIKEKLIFKQLTREQGVKIAYQLLHLDRTYFTFLFGARESKTWEDNFQKIYNTSPKILQIYARDFGVDMFIETGKFNLFRDTEKPLSTNYYEFWV